MATKKDVSTTEEIKNLPAEYDYGGYEGAGFENQDRSDYTIPLVSVMQALSPELETMANARPGWILNKATQEAYDGKTGVKFVPCYTQHVMVEWTPRDAGGGLVGVHTMDSQMALDSKNFQREGGKILTPAGTELSETFYVYGIFVDQDGNTCQAVIPFNSAKIKKYKSWMTKARTIQVAIAGGRKSTPPLFAHVYSLKTVKEKKPKGEFYNWDITFDGETAESCRLQPSNPLFQEAVAFMELVKSGSAKADHGNTSTDDIEDGVTEEPKAPNGKRPF
jgi:hypothetical protein